MSSMICQFLSGLFCFCTPRCPSHTSILTMSEIHTGTLPGTHLLCLKSIQVHNQVHSQLCTSYFLFLRPSSSRKLCPYVLQILQKYHLLTEAYTDCSIEICSLPPTPLFSNPLNLLYVFLFSHST